MLALILASVSAPFLGGNYLSPGATVDSRLSNDALEAIRGGFTLPNGLDVMLGIDIQTRVDGVLVLHTAYANEGVSAGVRVFTGGAGAVSLAPTAASGSGAEVVGTPVVQVDRSPAGTTILPTSSAPATTVNLVVGDPSAWQSTAGETPIPIAANGREFSTPAGAFTLTTGPTGAVVALKAADYVVRQLVGQATGVVVANTASNRTIETVSSVNVDIQGISAGRLAGLFATQRAILEGITTR